MKTFKDTVLGVVSSSFTEEHLKAAARRLCELRGLDPDEMVGHSPRPNADGSVNAVLLKSPRYRLVAGEIRAHLQIEEAVRFAVEDA